MTNKRSLLGNRGFRNLWLAGWLSRLGSEASAIAIYLYLFRNGNSVGSLALITAIRMLPAGLAAPWAGAVVDRTDRRRLMIAADAARLLLLVAVLAAPSTISIYVYTVLGSLASAFFDPARAASVPDLVAQDKLPDANGLDQTMGNLVMVGGPIAGAVMFVRWGLGWALVLDAATFLASALLLLRIGGCFRETATAAASSAWIDAKEGWNYLRAEPVLRQLVILSLLCMLAVGLWAPLAPFFNRDVLRAPEQILGYQIAAFGLGGAMGAAAAAGVCRRIGAGHLVLGGMLLEGFHMIVYSMSTAVWWSILLLMSWGFVVSLIVVATESLLQTIAAPTLRGRVFSTVRQAENLALAGAMGLAVILSQVASPRRVFALGGSFYMIAVAAAACSASGRALLAQSRTGLRPVTVGDAVEGDTVEGPAVISA